MLTNEIERQIQQAARQLLDDSRFYGEILLRLTRVYDDQAENAVDVRYATHQWQLVINPALFVVTYPTAENILGILTHQVLHLVWQHPIRYGHIPTDNLRRVVNLATDLAVNQYVKADFAGKVLPAKFAQRFHIQLPTFADSQQYYELLLPFLDDLQTSGGTTNDQAMHAGWATSQQSATEAGAALENLINQAQTDAHIAGRGRLPGSGTQAIEAHGTQTLNWRRILTQQRIHQAAEYHATRARFNRRQPYRIDLPGQVLNQQVQVVVFVDQSASINATLAVRFVNEARALKRQIQGQVVLYAFDSAVYPLADLTKRHQGGGTTYQALFDELKTAHFQWQHTQVVILTDGVGEELVDTHHFKNVTWVLPAQQVLSVSQPIGRVLYMEVEK
ncbi:DUF2201 family putative metallopeptidase [Weissella soli]|uniref:Putative metal-dependent peptidase n=1 Tax=Weissella soli TaxID=155866 RepID=A0A288Q5M8_9LACO|nr:VWA-like domain-containing protein [Weissella soli]AOT55937.1 hypothetical protein WSWS_00292 [Weissella soli]NKY83835.1 hypothetical protein [Weissella soli]RDL01541.1 putative metal-dependent peptidase [Weissella soli]GEN93750.1 hypothetical protein WSO01_13620 [Weissella soli]